MSDISLIADYLNTKLQASTGYFNGKAFQKGKFTGLCKQISRVLPDSTVEKQIILYDDVNGKEGTGVYPDDKYPFQLYHRIKEISPSDEQNDEFFGDGTDKILIFEMGLIVISDKFNVELSQEQLITGLSLDLPINIKPSAIVSSQFSDCEIKIGDVDTESSSVFNTEYGKAGELPQQFIMFALTYEIRLIYSKACYDLC